MAPQTKTMLLLTCALRRRTRNYGQADGSSTIMQTEAVGGTTALPALRYRVAALRRRRSQPIHAACGQERVKLLLDASASVNPRQNNADAACGSNDVSVRAMLALKPNGRLLIMAFSCRTDSTTLLQIVGANASVNMHVPVRKTARIVCAICSPPAHQLTTWTIFILLLVRPRGLLTSLRQSFKQGWDTESLP